VIVVKLIKQLGFARNMAQIVSGLIDVQHRSINKRLASGYFGFVLN